MTGTDAVNPSGTVINESVELRNETDAGRRRPPGELPADGEGMTLSTYQAPLGLDRVVGAAPGSLLRLALRLDAAASGALGLLTLLAGPALDELLGTPPALRWPVGLFLVAYATMLWVAAARPRLSQPVVWAVIVGNALWAIASVAVMVGDWVALTGLGNAAVLAQAVAVATFAALQFLGLRRARPVIG